MAAVDAARRAARRRLGANLRAGLVAVAVAAPGSAAAPPVREGPDTRARKLVARMSLDEKLVMVRTAYGMPLHGRPAPAGALGSAGFAPGVVRLGIPPLQETDGGLGVADPTNRAPGATAMPSALAMAATFDPDLAEAVGAAVGMEAHARGFDVLLGGGVNLVREPRGGRAFEYAGEDPLLSGVMAGAAVAGAQAQGVVATLKHFALNAQENGRVLYDAHLGEAAARESDLLAFEIALERGRAGAVVTAYNRVNGAYASENAHLLDDVLKGDWGFCGWVMSDWGGTHSTERAARAGLDQESGADGDAAGFFGAPLRAAVLAGAVPPARLDDMARRILRARIAAGQLDAVPRAPVPVLSAAHADLARRAAERAIVLLKNEGELLPLRGVKRVVVVGGHADVGVLSGGGSSQVVPAGALRLEGDPPGLFWGRPRLYDPSSPLAALRRLLPDAEVSFVQGRAEDRAEAIRAAAAADAAVVVAEQWSNESRDRPDLALPGDQDALIAAVAAANPRTVVVLETGGAVTMPWLAAVPAVVTAWYPGARGGEAVAAVLTGAVDPSGRLPITFPAELAQLPRPNLPRREDTASNPDDPPRGGPFTVDYDVEGADVGYRWMRRQHLTPLFAFGFGLSYTRFVVSDLSAVARDASLAVTFDVSNRGARAGTDTPQVYLEGPGLGRRLVGWGRVDLRPGETRRVGVEVDRRLIARFDAAGHGWRIAGGAYHVAVRPDALAEGPAVEVRMAPQSWPARHAGPGCD